jgi:hypothetical protein
LFYISRIKLLFYMAMPVLPHHSGWRARLFRQAAAVLALTFGGCAHGYTPQVGDIVFHTSLSSQSQAVQAATKSPYSHMGIVLLRDGKPYVLEAVQPVKYTPLPQWLDRGKDRRYVIKRLKSPLPQAAVRKLYQQSRRYAGKPCDLTFEPGNRS